jgi:hypothetical protein
MVTVAALVNASCQERMKKFLKMAAARPSHRLRRHGEGGDRITHVAKMGERATPAQVH